MVCVLFDHYFLLAKQVEDSRKLEAVACVYVWDLKIDSLRNGKGETYLSRLDGIEYILRM